MSEKELKVVIKSAAARERNKSRASRPRHRNTRLAAVAYYREQFGEAEFLQQFSTRKLEPYKRVWLPRGCAYWRERSNQVLDATASPRVR